VLTSSRSWASAPRPGHLKILVLSHGLWRREFHGDPRVVGRLVRCNRETYEIVGVLPADFTFALPGFFTAAEMWTPASLSADEAGRGDNSLRVLARLRPGVGLASAQTDVNQLAGQLGQRFPVLAGFGIRLVPLGEQLVRAARPSLLVLLSAVALLLLMACVNVSNLLLARATARRQELAVRAALGAPRLRILRQLMFESLGLATLGGASGLLLASALGRFLEQIAPRPLGTEHGNGVVLVFALVLSSASGLLAGIAPALRSTAQASDRAPATSARTAESRIGLRGGLVAAQVALALPLLVGAGLLIKTLALLVATEPGFNPNRVLSMRVILPPIAAGDDAHRVQYFQRLVTATRALPGVAAAAAIDDLPLESDRDAGSYMRQDRPPLAPEKRPVAQLRTVSSEYFRTLQIPFLAGRDFRAALPGMRVQEAIVNQHLARLFFPGEDPLGHHIALSAEPSPPEWLLIVGVVGDLHDLGLDDRGHDEIYLPISQNPLSWMTLVVRTEPGRPISVAALQEAPRDLDPGLPRFPVDSLDNLVFHSLDERRLRAEVLASFGLTALVLAAVGIYGVMSFASRSRTREIGIRMALGAPRARIFALLLRQGMGFVAIGGVIGLGITLLLTGLLRGLLVGVTPFDPTILALAATLLGLAALVACAWPTIRAVLIEPTGALRSE
jgi:putative ABC transport system permease protein